MVVDLLSCTAFRKQLSLNHSPPLAVGCLRIPTKAMIGSAFLCIRKHPAVLAYSYLCCSESILLSPNNGGIYGKITGILRWAMVLKYFEVKSWPNTKTRAHTTDDRHRRGPLVLQSEKHRHIPGRRTHDNMTPRKKQKKLHDGTTKYTRKLDTHTLSPPTPTFSWMKYAKSESCHYQRQSASQGKQTWLP